MGAVQGMLGNNDKISIIILTPVKQLLKIATVVKSQSFLPLLRMIVVASSKANRKTSKTVDISRQNGMKRAPQRRSKQAQ